MAVVLNDLLSELALGRPAELDQSEQALRLQMQSEQLAKGAEDARLAQLSSLRGMGGSILGGMRGAYQSGSAGDAADMILRGIQNQDAATEQYGRQQLARVQQEQQALAEGGPGGAEQAWNSGRIGDYIAQTTGNALASVGPQLAAAVLTRGAARPFGSAVANRASTLAGMASGYEMNRDEIAGNMLQDPAAWERAQQDPRMAQSMLGQGALASSALDIGPGLIASQFGKRLGVRAAKETMGAVPSVLAGSAVEGITEGVQGIAGRASSDRIAGDDLGTALSNNAYLSPDDVIGGMLGGGAVSGGGQAMVSGINAAQGLVEDSAVKAAGAAKGFLDNNPTLKAGIQAAWDAAVASPNVARIGLEEGAAHANVVFKQMGMPEITPEAFGRASAMFRAAGKAKTADELSSIFRAPDSGLDQNITQQIGKEYLARQTIGMSPEDRAKFMADPKIAGRVGTVLDMANSLAVRAAAKGDMETLTLAKNATGGVVSLIDGSPGSQALIADIRSRVFSYAGQDIANSATTAFNASLNNLANIVGKITDTAKNAGDRAAAAVIRPEVKQNIQGMSNDAKIKVANAMVQYLPSNSSNIATAMQQAEFVNKVPALLAAYARSEDPQAAAAVNDFLDKAYGVGKTGAERKKAVFKLLDAAVGAKSSVARSYVDQVKEIQSATGDVEKSAAEKGMSFLEYSMSDKARAAVSKTTTGVRGVAQVLDNLITAMTKSAEKGSNNDLEKMAKSLEKMQGLFAGGKKDLESVIEYYNPGINRTALNEYTKKRGEANTVRQEEAARDYTTPSDEMETDPNEAYRKPDEDVRKYIPVGVGGNPLYAFHPAGGTKDKFTKAAIKAGGKFVKGSEYFRTMEGEGVSRQKSAGSKQSERSSDVGYTLKHLKAGLLKAISNKLDTSSSVYDAVVKRAVRRMSDTAEATGTQALEQMEGNDPAKLLTIANEQAGIYEKSKNVTDLDMAFLPELLDSPEQLGRVRPSDAAKALRTAIINNALATGSDEKAQAAAQLENMQKVVEATGYADYIYGSLYGQALKRESAKKEKGGDYTLKEMESEIKGLLTRYNLIEGALAGYEAGDANYADGLRVTVANTNPTQAQNIDYATDEDIEAYQRYNGSAPGAKFRINFKDGGSTVISARSIIKYKKHKVSGDADERFKSRLISTLGDVFARPGVKSVEISAKQAAGDKTNWQPLTMGKDGSILNVPANAWLLEPNQFTGKPALTFGELFETQREIKERKPASALDRAKAKAKTENKKAYKESASIVNDHIYDVVFKGESFPIRVDTGGKIPKLDDADDVNYERATNDAEFENSAERLEGKLQSADKLWTIVNNLDTGEIRNYLQGKLDKYPSKEQVLARVAKASNNDAGAAKRAAAKYDRDYNTLKDTLENPESFNKAIGWTAKNIVDTAFSLLGSVDAAYAKQAGVEAIIRESIGANQEREDMISNAYYDGKTFSFADFLAADESTSAKRGSKFRKQVEQNLAAYQRVMELMQTYGGTMNLENRPEGMYKAAQDALGGLGASGKRAVLTKVKSEKAPVKGNPRVQLDDKDRVVAPPQEGAVHEPAPTLYPERSKAKTTPAERKLKVVQQGSSKAARRSTTPENSNTEKDIPSLDAAYALSQSKVKGSTSKQKGPTTEFGKQKDNYVAPSKAMVFVLGNMQPLLRRVSAKAGFAPGAIAQNLVDVDYSSKGSAYDTFMAGLPNMTDAQITKEIRVKEKKLSNPQRKTLHGALRAEIDAAQAELASRNGGTARPEYAKPFDKDEYVKNELSILSLRQIRDAVSGVEAKGYEGKTDAAKKISQDKNEARIDFLDNVDNVASILNGETTDGKAIERAVGFAVKLDREDILRKMTQKLSPAFGLNPDGEPDNAATQPKLGDAADRAGRRLKGIKQVAQELKGPSKSLPQKKTAANLPGAPWAQVEQAVKSFSETKAAPAPVENTALPAGFTKAANGDVMYGPNTKKQWEKELAKANEMLAKPNPGAYWSGNKTKAEEALAAFATYEGRSGKKSLAPAGNTAGGPALDGTPEKAQELLDGLIVMRGNRIKMSYDETVAMLGGSGEFEISDLGRIVRIAIDAMNPDLTVRHEALHDLWATLSKSPKIRRLKRRVEKYSTSPMVMQRVVHSLAKMEAEPGTAEYAAALQKYAQAIMTDPEEGVAYLFQQYTLDPEIKRLVSGHLDEPNTMMGKLVRPFVRASMAIASFLRSIAGVVTEDQQVDNILAGLWGGQFANVDIQDNAFLREAGQTVGDKLEGALGPVYNAASKVINTGLDRVKDMGIPALTQLADQVSIPTGDQYGGADFVSERQYYQNSFLSLFNRVLNDIPKERQKDLLHTLQSRTPSEDQDVVTIRTMFKQLHGAARSVGIDLGMVEDYFPTTWDTQAISEDRDAFSALLQKHGDMSAAEAEHVIDGMVMNGGGSDLAENENHYNYVAPMGAMRKRKLKFIDGDNGGEFAKFQVKDMGYIVEKYVAELAHRMSFAQHFGDQGEAIEEAFKRAEEQGATADELEEAKRAIQGALGVMPTPTLTEGVRTGIAWTMTALNTALLPLSLFSQLMDPLIVASRSGDIKDAGRAYMQALRGLRKTIMRDKSQNEIEEIADMLGVVETDLANQALGHVVRTPQGNLRTINREFFKWNGMQGFNNAMRVAATGAGMRYIRKAVDNQDYAALAEMGLNPASITTTADGRLDFRTNPQMKRALSRYVESSVIRPDNVHQPTWMNDPSFALLAHMRRFTYAFSQVALRRAWEQAGHGNLKPMGFLLAGIPVMIAVDMAKWGLTGTGPQTASWGVMDYLKHGINRSGMLGQTSSYISLVPGGGLFAHQIEPGPGLDLGNKLLSGDLKGSLDMTLIGHRQLT